MNTGTSPITITLNPGESSGAAYSLVSTVYDCTTWADYYQLNGQQYWGYKDSVKGSGSGGTQKTVTVLARSGSTASQNFAFDIGEDDI